MKGIDPKFNQHHIQVQEDAKPGKPVLSVSMNPNYPLRIKEEIDNLL